MLDGSGCSEIVVSETAMICHSEGENLETMYITVPTANIAIIIPTCKKKFSLFKCCRKKILLMNGRSLNRSIMHHRCIMPNASSVTGSRDIQ